MRLLWLAIISFTLSEIKTVNRGKGNFFADEKEKIRYYISMLAVGDFTKLNRG